MLQGDQPKRLIASSWVLKTLEPVKRMAIGVPQSVSAGAQLLIVRHNVLLLDDLDFNCGSLRPAFIVDVEFG
jgi:hypothetical protein